MLAILSCNASSVEEWEREVREQQAAQEHDPEPQAPRLHLVTPDDEEPKDGENT